MNKCIKKCLQLLVILAILSTLFTGLGTNGYAATITTNGNGDSSDVGVWYSSNWDVSTNQWWNLTSMRGLLPDWTYGEYSTNDANLVDFHLQNLAAAYIDFILLDNTNADFYGYWESLYPGNPGAGAWIKNNSEFVCSRIKIWNQNHSRKIRYAFAIGSWFSNQVSEGMGCVDNQASAILSEVYNNGNYTQSDYYQVDGKPLLVVYDFNKSAQTAWNNYSGSKNNANLFTVRFAGNPGANTPSYGWQLADTVVNSEVEEVSPGWNNHLGGSYSRNYGDRYVNNWDTVLNNPRPKIVIIQSFNDLTEDSAIFSTDTSTDYQGTRLPIERWYGHDGQLHPTMYWDYTWAIIKTLKWGDPKPTMAGQVSGGTIDTSKTYKVINRNSGKALQPQDASTADEANIVQMASSSGNEQKWQFIDAGGGYYKIKNVNSGKLMDIYGASTAQGANNIQYPDNGGINQQWQLIDVGGGYYKIQNKNSGLLLDISGASTADGAEDIQWPDNGGYNQMWQFVDAGSSNGGSNLAIGKTASVSSYYGAGYEASKINDSNMSTRWNSVAGGGVGDWVQIDFGTTTTFNKALSYQCNNRITGYKIQSSTDGTTWNDLVTSGAMGSGPKTDTFTAVSARYIRLYITSVQSDYGGTDPTLWEFEVYNQ